jgi:enamine deaminase RidA (YjgF/YER057c/UK114 family)
MHLIHLNPPQLPNWSQFFSQVVVAEGSSLRLVTISGQVGVDERQALAGDGSFLAQTDRAFANLVVALAAARCSVADVAKLTIYVVDYDHGKAQALHDTVRKHFGDGPLPACTLVGVQALARPEFQVEVEALAISTSIADEWFGPKHTTDH